MIEVGISVIIPHYNDLAALDRCLTALEEQSLSRNRYEIIVADNMSPVGLSAVADVVGSRARLILAKERGAGPARNVAVAASNGNILCFTDSDCRPDPHWLAAGILALERYDIAGGGVTVAIDHDGLMSGAEAFETVFAFNNRKYVQRQGFSVTANLFCRRIVFETAGPFRTGVPEDLEWCQRAKRSGFKIGYAADAVVCHPARTDWPCLRRKWRRLNIESYALALSQPFGRLRWGLRNLMLPLSVVAHAPIVLTSPKLNTWVERRRGLATLARLRLWRFVDAQRLLIGGR